MEIPKLFRRNKAAYETTFRGPTGKVVLADLAVFCRMNKSTFTPGDADAQKHLEGRREVFLRIQEHIQLTDDELWQLIQERNQ